MRNHEKKKVSFSDGFGSRSPVVQKPFQPKRGIPYVYREDLTAMVFIPPARPEWYGTVRYGTVRYGTVRYGQSVANLSDAH